MLYGKGISKEGEILDMGVEHELIEKSGPWYSYGSERIGQGRENARIFLADNPDTTEEIRRRILEKAGFAQEGKKEAAEGVKKQGEGVKEAAEGVKKQGEEVKEAAEEVKKQEKRKKGG